MQVISSAVSSRLELPQSQKSQCCLTLFAFHYVASRYNIVQYNRCFRASMHAQIHYCTLNYLYSIPLHYFTLHHIALYQVASRHTSHYLHCITLHYITLRYKHTYYAICDPCPTAIQQASMLLRTGLRTTSPGKTGQKRCL